MLSSQCPLPITLKQSEFVNRTLECYLRWGENGYLWQNSGITLITILPLLLKFHLKRAQDRMASLANKHRTDRQFAVGEFVYLKLQPHRQVTLRQGIQNKLSPKYYGPFEIVARVGKVAYRLKLPGGSCNTPGLPCLPAQVVQRSSNSWWYHSSL